MIFFFPEVRNRKETESGLVLNDDQTMKILDDIDHIVKEAKVLL